MYDFADLLSYILLIVPLYKSYDVTLIVVDSENSNDYVIARK